MPAATPYPLICSNNLSDVPRPDVAIATLSQGGLAAPTFVDGERTTSIVLVDAAGRTAMLAPNAACAGVPQLLLSAGVGIGQTAGFLTDIVMLGTESNGIGLALGDSDAFADAEMGFAIPGLYVESFSTSAYFKDVVVVDGSAQNDLQYPYPIHATQAGAGQLNDMEWWLGLDGCMVGVSVNGGLFCNTINLDGALRRRLSPTTLVLDGDAAADAAYADGTLGVSDLWVDYSADNAVKCYGASPS